MARRNKAQRDLNRTGRMTPYDARTAGTFSEAPRTGPRPVRPPTADEIRASNYAKVDLAEKIGNVRAYVPEFREDLARMNEGKVGRPYEYSDALVFWLLTAMTLFNSDYRCAVGFFGPVLGYMGVRVPSYTRFLERCHALAGEHLLEEGCDVKRRYGGGVLSVYVSPYVTDRVRRVGADSSGLSLSCPNRRRGRKWKGGTKDRGWLRFHVLSDLDTGEILAYAVSDESVGDAPLLRLLVGMAAEGGHRFEKIYADGAYSSNRNWIYLTRENGYEFVTSFKVNTRPVSNGCLARGLAAGFWCKTPYKVWTEATGYHFRWKSETGFSDFKEIFPETVTATSVRGMVLEVMARTEVFNAFKRGRAAIMKVTGNGVEVA